MVNIKKIGVVGDSVAWGQGLLDQNKYAYQVAGKLGVVPSDVSMQAHSGAKIGVHFTGNQALSNGEVPESAPTILFQVGQVPNPAAIDLVLVNGGINDVGFEKIISPLTRNSDLSLETYQRCRDDMTQLLTQVGTVFSKPSCQIIVTGYYPILSYNSGPHLFSRPDHLDRLLCLHSLVIAPLLDRATIIDHIISLTMQFWRESEDALAQAVAASLKVTGMSGRVIRFVPSPFAETNALFATDPWLFGFDSLLGPEDEVIAQRTTACNIQYPNHLDLASRELCYHASVGHPNDTGADAMTNAIMAVLNANAT
jgi:lysophospholipase L1-like esterase